MSAIILVLQQRRDACNGVIRLTHTNQVGVARLTRGTGEGYRPTKDAKWEGVPFMQEVSMGM